MLEEAREVEGKTCARWRREKARQSATVRADWARSLDTRVSARQELVGWRWGGANPLNSTEEMATRRRSSGDSMGFWEETPGARERERRPFLLCAGGRRGRVRRRVRVSGLRA